ncbi:hypothetical protein CDZ97_15695 [Mameliella alba]|nr:hypothetical protein CDZ95_15320 [Mameliella alba]OWV62214.1 hypothetical protein CDZ97_15695 [Mameliella alba]
MATGSSRISSARSAPPTPENSDTDMVPTSTHGAIVVTGASRGIGAAIAAALVEEGVNVACLSRSGAMPDLPEGAHEDLRRRFHPIACDIADEAGFAEALRQTSDRFGDIARAGQQRGRA